MNRVIKFRYRYTNGTNWIFQVFTLAEICNGMPFEVLSDNPLLKNYRYDGEDLFSSLTDKHGVEIYEGDVVSKCYSASVKTGVVAWHQERAMFIFQDGYNEPLYQLPLNMVEVIGNVFANPELIN